MNKFRKPHGSGGNRGFGGGGQSRPSFGGGSRPSFGGGRPSFAGSRDSGGEKYDAICATCGKKCQVPFRPNGKKPVYCSDCFGAQHREEPAGGERRDSFPKRDFAPRPSFEQRNERPFAPRDNAPAQAPRQDDRVLADLKQQVGILTGKIDSILRILQASPRMAEQASVAAAPVATQPKPFVVPNVPAKNLPPMVFVKAAAMITKKSVPVKSAKKPAKKKGPNKK